MSAIIRDLPFKDHNTSVQVRRHVFPVKRDQIVLWVSLSEMGVHKLHADVPRLPAILDVGCNHNFMIHERHLIEWAGIQAKYLRPLGKLRVSGRVVSQVAASIWLHPNRPGQRDEFSSQPPFPLEVPEGIALVPAVSGQAIYTLVFRFWGCARFVPPDSRSQSIAIARP